MRIFIMLVLLLVNILYQSKDVSGAIYFSRASGNWNDASTWSTTSFTGAAAASAPGNAVGDVVMISGHTVTVTATPVNAISSLIVSQNYNSGNDTKLYLNTVGVILTCNSLSVTDNNRNNNVDVQVDKGTLQVNGSVSFTRTTSNAQDDRVRLNVTGNGTLSVTGNLNYTLNRAANNSTAGTEIELNGQGIVNVNGNVNLVCGNLNASNNILEFQINDTARFNIGGNLSLTVSNSDDSDDIIVDLNGGILDVTGTLKATAASSCNNNNCIYIYIDGATLESGELTLEHNGGGGGDMEIRMNSVSTSISSSLTVNGDISFMHNSGDNMTLQVNSNSILNATGDINFDLNSSNDGDCLYADFNGGQINASGFNVNIDSSATSANSFFMSADETIIAINNDFIVNQAGGTTGDINIMFNQSAVSSCVMTVGGDMILHHTEGDNLEIELNANSEITVEGNFIDTLNSSDGDDFYIDINGGIFNVNGDFTHYGITSGGVAEDLNIRLDDNGNFNVDGDVDINNGSGGQVSIYLNYTSGTNAQWSVGGNMTIVNEAAGDGIYIETDDSSVMSVNGNLSIINHADGGDIARVRIKSSSTAIIVGDLTMTLDAGSSAVADNIQIDIDSGALVVNGNLQMISTAGNDAIITVDETGSLSVTGELALLQTGGDVSYIYIGNTSGSPSVSAGAVRLYDYGGGQTRCRLWNSASMTVEGDIIMDADAVSQVDFALYGTSYLTLRGNFQRNTSRYGILSCSVSSTIEFAGTSMQTLPGNTGGGTDAFTFGNLIFNNSSGFTTSAAEGNITIPASANLNFSSGIINTSSSALLILSSGTTVSAVNDNSYVDGPVRKIGNQSFTFPIGDNGNYQPAAISAPSNATHHFTAQYIAEDPATVYSDNSLDGSIDHISGCEYWLIDRTGGASNVSITLSWDGGSCGVDELSSLRVVRWDGTAWRDHGNGGTSGTVAAGTIVNSLIVSSYLLPGSPFTIASLNSNNPLPVELLSFEAIPKAGFVDIYWATASESGNDYFNIERSAGDQFDVVATIDGKGNSNQIQEYTWQDTNPLEGLSYYRLKQTDFNGKQTYSTIRKVIVDKSRNNLSIFPNPVYGNVVHITPVLDNDADVKLISLDGSIVLPCEITSYNNDYSVMIAPSEISSGIYLLQVIDEGIPSISRVVFQKN